MHAHKIVQLRFWGSSTPPELVARVIGKRFCGNGVINENLCDPKKHQSFSHLRLQLQHVVPVGAGLRKMTNSHIERPVVTVKLVRGPTGKLPM